jgi:hypothetical protein
MQHIINNVSVLYPRLNQPYRFDSGENKSVPCQWDDEGACYETSFVMEKDEAVTLGRICKEAYKNAASMGKGKWPAEPQRLPAKTVKADDGTTEYHGKCRIKAKYGSDKTQQPKQVDAKRNPFPSDFRLTSGSKANIAVTVVPYNTGTESGVSLRIRAVQVTELAAEQVAADPFSVVDGYTTDSTFVSAPAPVEDLLEDDEIPF